MSVQDVRTVGKTYSGAAICQSLTIELPPACHIFCFRSFMLPICTSCLAGVLAQGLGGGGALYRFRDSWCRALRVTMAVL